MSDETSSYERSVSDHYAHGGLLAAVEAALPALGKTLESVTVEDLAPVDEFHVGGRAATDHLFDQLGFKTADTILDVGCGLGGAARYLADREGCRVTGIDLTPEYVETGKALCEWVGLQDQIHLQAGSALAMPFPELTFDGAYMLHVGMNIEDKAALFAEVSRVMKPGATFGLYDIMRLEEGDLAYPVPWAKDHSTSKLATLGEYETALREADFDIVFDNPRRDFALAFFAQLRARNAAAKGAAPLGLHTLMQASTAVKTGNLVQNISAGLVAPVEVIARKKTR